MLSLRPSVHQIKHLLGYASADLTDRAIERWTIAPARERLVPPAKFLPGQLERILGAEFGSIESVVRDFLGGHVSQDGETVAFRLKDVDLVDGVLYGSGCVRHLRRRTHRRPWYSAPGESASGALYESWIGNRWFGSWLMEDCLTHDLARRCGQPYTSAPLTTSGHVPGYESLLGISPVRVSSVHFHELIVFRDGSNNEGKKQRADAMRERLTLNAHLERHPGVLLLRGDGGDRRVLLNEREMADHLASKRGFKVLDPVKASVDEIVSACAGARVVAGVEGSQLVHGLMCMPPDATLLVIQPPHRVVSVLKSATDRQGQTFSFVVASGGREEFTASLDEVERTLDLAGGC